MSIIRFILNGLYFWQYLIGKLFSTDFCCAVERTSIYNSNSFIDIFYACVLTSPSFPILHLSVLSFIILVIHKLAENILDSYLRRNSIPSSIGLKQSRWKSWREQRYLKQCNVHLDTTYVLFASLLPLYMYKWYYIVVHPRVIVY